MKIITLYLLISLTLLGCQKVEITKNEKLILLEYLKSKLIQPAFGGKIYGDLTILKKTNNEIYVWTILQEYYIKNNRYKEGTGISLPLKIKIKNWPIKSESIESVQKPRDGSLYSDDISKLFPKEIHDEILNFSNSTTARKMLENIKEMPQKNITE